MTSPRVRIDDIGTVDEIRMNRLAPLLETVDRAVKAIEEAEVPRLGTFADAERSSYEHQKVIADVRAEVQSLMWELVAVVSRNEEVMAAFREGIEADVARLSRMLDADLLDVEAPPRPGGGTGSPGGTGGTGRV